MISEKRRWTPLSFDDLLARLPLSCAELRFALSELQCFECSSDEANSTYSIQLQNRVLHMKYKNEKFYRLDKLFSLIFLAGKYSTLKIKKLQETVRKAVQTGIKLIHCNDDRTMFAYFHIII